MPVATGKLRRSSNPLGMLTAANMKDMARVPLGVAQARSIVADFKPDVILSTGGYVAVPIGIAAGMLRRPLVVHEQTVRLGLANRLLAKRATRVAVSSPSTLELLPEAVRERTVVTGNPVRAEVLAGEPLKAVDALGLHSFDPDLPVLYVTGGAQGSVQINTLVTEALPWLLQQANVIHQSGPNNLQDMFDRTATLPAELAARYRVTGFVGAELPDVLALADVVISRSGAGTIAELTALGKPAVLVPLPSRPATSRRTTPAGSRTWARPSPWRATSTDGPPRGDRPAAVRRRTARADGRRRPRARAPRRRRAPGRRAAGGGAAGQGVTGRAARAAPGHPVTKSAIIAMSSCSRLWQCSR